MLRNRRAMTTIGLAATALVLLSACAAEPAATPATSSPESAVTATRDPQSAPPSERPSQGAVPAFRAWLDASRVPDPDTACAALAPALVTRMIAELAEKGIVVGDCAEMIASTAALYRATGQDAEVDIAVQAETTTEATLFVTYLASGNCGTVVMSRPGTDWIITEQSQECAL